MPTIEDIKRQYQELLTELSDPELISDWKKFEALTQKKALFENILAKEEEFQEIKKKIEENEAILAAQEDSELSALAEEELKNLTAKQKGLEQEVADSLQAQPKPGLPESSENQEAGTGSIIIEIRAGTGGGEAALFATDLFKMYSKYAASQGWKSKTLDSHPTEIGGFKEIIFEIEGEDAFAKLQHEGGVHRVQRIPVTEKSGRVHTSTASVAVLPKPKKSRTKIRPDDLRIDFYRSSGPGGQYVNKRETAVRITHVPSGLVVTSQTERNQLQNRENALKILEARLLEKEKTEQAQDLHGKRKAQIKWAKRAEKIRTYNFPQDRITDHRIKKNFHNIEKILNGDLNPIISVLKTLL